MKKIGLIIVDPQVDFCDPNGGSLYVAGAEKSMSRVADMIKRLGNKLVNINVTMDCHHQLDIAHPMWWVDGSGNNRPNPFTIITEDDVKKGVWRAARPELQQMTISYVEALTANARYPLCVWPPHCLIGHPGNNVFPVLLNALDEWEARRNDMVVYVTKGSNPFTEHYSAVQADVPMSNDPTTMLNTGFIQQLEQLDMLAIAGEARSHCVAYTIRDIAANFGADNVKKMVLLEDGMDDVTGFENFGEDFMKDMIALGMSVSTTVDFLA